MSKFKNFFVAVVVTALVVISAVGCNTIRGAGRDVEKGGQGIQDAADGAQNR